MAKKVNPNNEISCSHIIKINDLFCEWEFGFKQTEGLCIETFIEAIEAKLKITRQYEKPIRRKHWKNIRKQYSNNK